jgi:hypothetical protein
MPLVVGTPDDGGELAGSLLALPRAGLVRTCSSTALRRAASPWRFVVQETTRPPLFFVANTISGLVVDLGSSSLSTFT